MISNDQKNLNSGFGAKSEPSEILDGINLSGKTAIVTGGYSGIGIETTRALSEAGANVIIPARRTEEAMVALDGIIPKDHIFEMDLSDLDSIKRFTDLVKNNLSLSILINNAGIMACPESKTSNGWDLQFAVNHIGHFVLTHELIDSMDQSSGARIINLSSTAHKFSGICWDDIHFSNSYDKWVSYGQSKTATSLFSIELDRRFKDKNIRSFAVHPGGIFTPLQRHLQQEEMVTMGWLNEDGSLSELAKAGFKSSTQGASTSLWAATSSQLDNKGGLYCENCDVANLAGGSPEERYFGVRDWAVDSDEAKKLWHSTEKMLANI
jgi:NAD(P)-dependent dehydrogenase (short-subunit alcohol dehydrogenase family)